MKRFFLFIFAVCLAAGLIAVPAKQQNPQSFIANDTVKVAEVLDSARQKAIADSIALVERGRRVQDSLANVDIWKDIEMEAIVVKAMAPRVMVKDDTIQFNASQFRTAEGSVVEELVAKLPGAEIDDDGNVKINGKSVKKILVDGEEFMTGDTKTALKNLPTSIIDKIKTYDQKSDLARITGIEDGDEETVLDFGIKAGMNKGTMINADLAAGTKDRFAERLFGGVMKDGNNLFFMGSMNNTNDMGFPGGGGGRRWGGAGGGGDNISKMAGLNYNLETKTLKFDASVRWNHNNGDARTVGTTENFLVQTGNHSTSNRLNFTRSNSWNGQLRLEWQPTEKTNIMFRPSFSLSTNDGASKSESLSYGALVGANKVYSADSLLNSNLSTSLSYSENNNANGMLQINQRLSDNGRNITLRFNGGYSDGESTSMSINNITYNDYMNGFAEKSGSNTYRYSLTPSKRYNYTIRTTYSEPIFEKTYLQFQYAYSYSLDKSDRATYDFAKAPSYQYNILGVPAYRDWASYLDPINGNYEQYKDDMQSRYSEYKNYTNEFQLTFRMIRDNYQLNAGVMLQPQKTKFMQDYQGVKVDTVRNVTNFSPTLDFRYNFSRQHTLRVNYRGRTSQPSISNLLSIVDDSNPLNVSTGNPGLKPSFSQNVFAFYNNYITNHQQAIMANINFSTTKNSVSSKVRYFNERTEYGGRTYEAGSRLTTPENIDGNWNIGGSFMYNTSIDSAGVWYTNTNTSINYNNRVGYMQLDQSKDSQKSTTRETIWTERLTFGFRNDWLDVSLDGTLTYDHSVNLLQSQNNMDTKQWNLGGSIIVYAPWGTQISTNMHQQMRRGYLNDDMNTNELIWNAQISQSFLRGNALTLSLQFYDILQQSSSISRSITAMQMSESRNNSVLSYALLHGIYRFNAFGGKAARGQGGPRDGYGPGRGGMPPYGGPGMGGPGMGGMGGPGMGGPGMGGGRRM